MLKKVARRLLGKPQPATAVALHPFDLAHGTDTSGLIERQHLRTGHANDTQNTAYFGVPPSRFRNAVESWRTSATLPMEQFRFVDLGCGKGRAVLLASHMPFREVVGVELHPELAAIARSNLLHWQQAGTVAEASIICEDAPTALPELLDGPTLLYLYNPFQAQVLRQVLQAVVGSRASSFSAPVDVLYLYPQEEQVFEEFPAFQRLWHRFISISGEDADDGISAATDPCSLYRLLPMSLQ